METQVRTPQMVFMQPQRLVVPLFQRPYVWNEENQWEPLWNDVVRAAERLLNRPFDKHYPHFLVRTVSVLDSVKPRTVRKEWTRTSSPGRVAEHFNRPRRPWLHSLCTKRLSVRRNGEVEGAPRPHGALYPHASAVGFYDAVGDWQPQAGAFVSGVTPAPVSV